MTGVFGVFDGVELLAEFADDVAADEHRRDLLQESFPEHLRRSPYDSHDLEIYVVPSDYELWWRLLSGLRRSRAKDRVLDQLEAVKEEHLDSA